MSDFEDRVRGALQGGAEEAPAGDGLVAGARHRLRQRRRTAFAAVAVAAVLVAVPVGVTVLDRTGTPEPTPPAADPTGRSSARDMPTGWHVETWRDLEILVPNTWGYGSLSTWCLGGESTPQPVVERPGGVVEPIACARPVNGYGVQFLDASKTGVVATPGAVHQYHAKGDVQRYPEGAWIGYAGTLGDGAIRVVARLEYTARFLVKSAQRLDEADSNGCEPTADLAVTGGVPVLQGISEVSAVSVCGYDVLAGPATLEPLAWSSRLTGDAAQELLGTIKASALHANASARRCLQDPFGPAYLLRFGDEQIWVRPVGSCPPDGAVVDGAQTRFLTPEILDLVARAGPGGGVS